MIPAAASERSGGRKGRRREEKGGGGCRMGVRLEKERCGSCRIPLSNCLFLCRSDVWKAEASFIRMTPFCVYYSRKYTLEREGGRCCRTQYHTCLNRLHIRPEHSLTYIQMRRKVEQLHY